MLHLASKTMGNVTFCRWGNLAIASKPRWFALLCIIICSALGVLVPFVELKFAIAAMVGFSVVFLLGKPEVFLALQLAGFFLYPTSFQLLGLSTNSDITAGVYLLLAGTYTASLILTDPDGARGFFALPATQVLVVFTIYIFVNFALLSSDNPNAMTKLVFVALLMWAPYFGAYMLNARQYDNFLIVVAGLGMVSAGMSAIRLFTGEDVTSLRFSVSAGMDPLSYAYSLGISTCALAVLALHNSSRLIRIILVPQLVISSTFILMSGSRGPLLSLIAACVTMVSLLRAKYRFYAALLALLCSVAIIALLPSLPLRSSFRYTSIIEVVTGALNDDSNSTSSSAIDTASAGRISLWRSSLATWYERPLFGTGLGNGRGAESTVALTYAHNFLLEILVELGLVGAVLFLIFLFIVLRNLSNTIATVDTTPNLVFAIALFAFALVQVTFSLTFVAATPFWLACGLLVSGKRKVEP